MKIRMLHQTRVSADDKGTRTRFLRLGQLYESGEEWEHDLFARLCDAGLAEEANKAIEDVPETKAPPKRRRKRS